MKFNLFLLLVLPFVSPQPDQSLQTYIVQLHPHDTSFFHSKRQWHLSFIHKSSLPKQRMLYSYTSTMEGFAARLSQEELAALRKLPGVLSVRPDRKLHLHTTYSYEFLGLNPNSHGSAWVRSRFGSGAIIGVLDTGVWPDSPSFDDSEMATVPKKWKGKCEEGENFNASNCNRKIIGARFFAKGHRVASSPNVPPGTNEYASPRDSHGHGTHTSSTAGGAAVATASVLGNGAGVARGLAPGAHIAVYKVCWFSGCYSSDILAAMDVAIRDGVDILSLSLGSFPIPLYDDTIAIGSFRAVEHGVAVVCSAGNNGPIAYSVANEAPWIITVGASTLDRRFPAPVRTRNNDVFYGESMYPRMNQLTKMEELDLIYLHGSELCLRGSLPRDKVRGKMVVCDRGANGRAEKGEVVKEAGGAAMILTTAEINNEDDSVDVHVLPATQLGFHESTRLKSYINSTARPMARIEFDGTVIEKDTSAPSVARFSSRGPSLTDPSVLKPDVIAPGVNIIAAWPQNLGPSGLLEDPRRVNFTVMSGTSMSCPHVSGIAALVRSAHPEWSPAAVKSAIMTTSDATDHLRKPIMDGHEIASVFAIGSGQVNPSRVIDPGLVYDLSPLDYITHLCNLGYKSSDIFVITHRNVSCHKAPRGSTLNYPSISLRFKKGTKRKMVRRQVTNVGDPDSIYSVEVMAPPGLKVRVRPTKLVFKKRNQKLSYRVLFIRSMAMSSSRKRKGEEFDGGYLAWINREITVRSPIAVTWE